MKNRHIFYTWFAEGSEGCQVSLVLSECCHCVSRPFLLISSPKVFKCHRTKSFNACQSLHTNSGKKNYLQWNRATINKHTYHVSTVWDSFTTTMAIFRLPLDFINCWKLFDKQLSAEVKYNLIISFRNVFEAFFVLLQFNGSNTNSCHLLDLLFNDTPQRWNDQNASQFVAWGFMLALSIKLIRSGFSELTLGKQASTTPAIFRLL